MTEKTEWEVVDAPSPGAQARSAGQGLPHLLREILGPHWKWKIAGGALLVALALAVVIALTGIVVVTLMAVAILSIAVATVRRWLRGSKSAKRDMSMRPR